MSIAKGLASTGFVAALLALLLTPIFFGAGTVQAQQQPGADVYGDSDAGGVVVEGDVIVVSIGDNECASLTAGAGGGWYTLIQPGDDITTLDDTTRIKVDFRVPETALAALKSGQTVEARSVAFPDRRFEGRVETLDSRVDPATRSIEVRTLLPNEDGFLKPGMFLTATLVVSRRPDAVLIPEEAIISRSDGQHVFAVIEGVAVLTPVTLGVYRGGKVEVVTGLAPGVEVITGGVQKVRDGVSVEVIRLGDGEGEGA